MNFVEFPEAKWVVVLAHHADRESVAAGVAVDVSGQDRAMVSEYQLSIIKGARIVALGPKHTIRGGIARN